MKIQVSTITDALTDAKEHENELRYAQMSRLAIARLNKLLAENELEHSQMMRDLFREQALLRDLNNSLRRYQTKSQVSGRQEEAFA